MPGGGNNAARSSSWRFRMTAVPSKDGDFWGMAAQAMYELLKTFIRVGVMHHIGNRTESNCILDFLLASSLLRHERPDGNWANQQLSTFMAPRARHSAGGTAHLSLPTSADKKNANETPPHLGRTLKRCRYRKLHSKSCETTTSSTQWWENAGATPDTNECEATLRNRSACTLRH